MQTNGKAHAVAIGNANHMEQVARVLEGIDREASLAAEEYGMEVLRAMHGVHRVAIVREATNERIAVVHGNDALLEATEYMNRLNIGTLTPDQMWPAPKVHPGDVVTIHRGHKRYEVARVGLDSFFHGERCDYAWLIPCAPENEHVPGWVAMDLLHKVEPVATIHMTQACGRWLSTEVLGFAHHSTGEAETWLRRVEMKLPDSGVALLVETHAYPADTPTLYPGDSVTIERPSGNYVYRWLPDLEDMDEQLQDVTALVHRIS